ncbi:MAG TPA: PEGA domain-containing protein [Thermoanaerobaculia bacterium]
MTDQPPIRPRGEDDFDEAAPMPRWVPIAIGVVLVTLASLAVITGLRYRDQTLVRIVQPKQHTVRPTAPAPPGEPEPGASLMFPGDASNVPPAHEPVAPGSRAEITGGPGGVSGVIKLWARRGLRTSVTPPDAVVYVNGLAIGQANQFDSENEEYDFAAPGSYTIRLVAPGYKERQFVVTADENAKAEVATIQVRLDKQ